MFSTTPKNVFGTPGPNTKPTTLFGSNQKNDLGTMFGSTLQTGNFNSTPTSTGLFGDMAAPQQLSTNVSQGGFGFGTPQTSTTGSFATQSQQLPNTGLFGSQSNNPSQTSSSSGLFGSQTNVSGQPSQTTGLFGSQQNTNTSQQNSGTGLFGIQNNPPQTPLFGTPQQSATSLFGQGAGGSGLFGSTSLSSSNQGGLFSTSTPQTSSSVGLFGSTNSEMGLFSSSSTLGTSSATQKPFGTKSIPYREEYDAAIQGRIQSITYLPEVKQTKCIEELRFEDYAAGSNTQVSNAFGNIASRPILGTGPANPTTINSTMTGGLLGQAATSTPSIGLFGSTSNASMNSGSSFFGQSQPSTTTTLGQPQAPTVSPFTQSQTPASLPFGQPSSNLFGNLSSTSGTGQLATSGSQASSIFGSKPAASTPTTTPLFGTSMSKPSGASLFGNNSLFSSNNTSNTSTISTTLAPSTTGSLFGKNPQSGTGLFGSSNTVQGFSQPKGLFESSGTEQSTATLGQGGLFNGTALSGGTSNTLSGSFVKPTGSLFGNTPSLRDNTSSSLFQSTTLGAQQPSGLFGSTAGPISTNKGSTASLFGGTSFAPTPNTGQLGGSDGLFSTNNQINSLNKQSPFLSSASTPSLFRQENSGLTNSLLSQPFGTTQNISAPSLSAGKNTLNSTNLSTWDPHGLYRITPLVESRYFIRNNFPSVPNPFSFPACGVILPTQYRKKKSTALSRLWQSFTSNTSNGNQYALSSLAPKRMTNDAVQMTLKSTATATPVTLKSDYTYPESTSGDLLKSGHLQKNSVFLSMGRTRNRVQSTNHMPRRNHVFRLSIPNSPTRISNELSPVLHREKFYPSGQQNRFSTEVLRSETTHSHKPKKDGQRLGIQPSGFTMTPRMSSLTAQESSCQDGNPPWLGRSDYSTQKLDTDRLTRRTGRLDDLISIKPTKNIEFSDFQVKCTRSEYSTRPSLETLNSYTESRLAAVEDFTVVHEEFGEITWPGLTDVRGLSIDDDVVIEDRAVEVYPSSDDDSYVPVGEGLNKPAIVTLYNCRPKEAESALSPEEEAALYQQHVEKIRWFTQKLGAHFIALTPQWVWKFRVEHFSRYSLCEHCDENETTAMHSQKTFLSPRQARSELNGPLPLVSHARQNTTCFNTLLSEFYKNFCCCKAGESFMKNLTTLERMMNPNCRMVFSNCLDSYIKQYPRDWRSQSGPVEHSFFEFNSIYLKYIDSMLQISLNFVRSEDIETGKVILLQLQAAEEFLRSCSLIEIPEKMKRFIEYSVSCWKLTHILFGDVEQDFSESPCYHVSPNLKDSLEQIDNDLEYVESIENECKTRKVRISLLGEWFRQVNTQTIEKLLLNDTNATTTTTAGTLTLLPAEAELRLNKAFYYMTTNNIKAAVHELLCYNEEKKPIFFRLALCLTSSASASPLGVPSNRQPLFQQLIEWQKINIYSAIPLCILRLYHVLAGCIDRLVSSQAPDWKTLFALLLWYPSLDTSLYLKKKAPFVASSIKSNKDGIQYVDKIRSSQAIHRAFYTYTEHLLKIPNQTATPAPLPEHFGVVRRNLYEDDSLDIQFSLLKLFCSESVDYTKMFHLSCIAHDPCGTILFWCLFHALKPFLNIKAEDTHRCSNFERYLEHQLEAYLKSLGLWKWSVLLLLKGATKMHLSEENALCRLVDLLYASIPWPFATSAESVLSSYSSSLNFVIGDYVGVPLYLISYVHALRYRDQCRHLQSSCLWLHAAISRWEENQKDSSVRDFPKNLPLFQKAFQNGVPPYVCPSSTSLFFHGLLNLLVSTEFFHIILQLCSLLGHPAFVWKALVLNEECCVSGTDSTTQLFQQLLQSARQLFQQAIIQDLSPCWTLKPNTFFTLSQEIVRHAHLFIFDKEWEKCPLMPLCHFIEWSFDTLVFQATRFSSESLDIVDKNVKCVDTLTRLVDTAYHLHSVLEDQLNKLSPKFLKSHERNEDFKSLLLVGDNLQRASELPAILQNSKVISRAAFHALGSVKLCLSSVLKAYLFQLSLDTSQKKIFNSNELLNDYGYGMLLTS